MLRATGIRARGCPTRNELRDVLSRIFADAQPNDKIVFYYTGHGEIKGGQFYLLTTDSELHWLSGTALDADDLMHMVLESRLNHVLLILDTCYSGRGIASLTEIASRYGWDRRAESDLHFIASAQSKEEATQGAFAAPFVEAVANLRLQLGGRTQPYLQPSAIISAINGATRQEQRQHPIHSSSSSYSSCLIPNPQYDSRAQVGFDVETLRLRHLTEHFVPRARGGDLASDVWYFTGRESARRELVSWLESPNSSGRPCIVTGSPGTGKSALLGWLVAFSNPQMRPAIALAVDNGALDPATTPPVGSIDLALHVRGMDQADVVRAIGERVAVDANGPAALVEGLKRREKRFTLVIDALDEAADTRGITKLLRELAPIPHVWVAVGTQPNERTEDAERRFTALGPRTVEIDLDDPRYLGSDDIARYVERRLLAEHEPRRHTPYRGLPAQAKMAAIAVARRAGTNFLIASILCRTLMDADSPPDVTGQNWQDLSGIDEAFDDYLNRFDNLRFTTRLDRRRVYNMLRPLAFAEGQGLPWDNVWAMLASAISGEPYSDSDIEELLNHAGAYIIETLEHGCSVYRLYHQALADYFRRDESHGRQIQRRIVDALDRSIPIDTNVGGPIWRNTHWYILAHYAAHAAAADYTDKLRGRLLDGFFATRKLELTDVGALIADYDYLPGDADLRLIQSAMRLSAHVIARDPRQFASQLVGRLLPYEIPLARHFTQSVVAAAPRPWLRPLKPALQPPGTGLRSILAGHTNMVDAVAVTPDGRRAVSASADHTAKVWELETGRELHTLAGHINDVNAVAVTPDGRRAVSASDDRTLKVWELETGRELHTLAGHTNMVDAVAVTPDGRRAVSASDDRTLKVWELETGIPIATYSCDASAQCCAVANDWTIIAGDQGGRVHILALEM